MVRGLCCNTRADLSLQSLASVFEQIEYRLRAGSHASARVWPTGFRTLDNTLGEGFRSGELALLAGLQGVGKSTFALQVLRYAANSGRSGVYFSLEHDSQSLLERLIALEAGMIAGNNAPLGLEAVRQAFEGVGAKLGTIRDRLSDTDLEFRKQFHQTRFEGRGQPVAEQLQDDRLYVE